MIKKYVLIVCGILVFFSIVFLLDNPKNEKKGTMNGLQVSFSSPKTTYYHDESFVITYTIKNISFVPKKIKTASDVISTHTFWGTSLKDFQSYYEEVQIKTYKDYGKWTRGDVILFPGQTFRVKLKFFPKEKRIDTVTFFSDFEQSNYHNFHVEYPISFTDRKGEK